MSKEKIQKKKPILVSSKQPETRSELLLQEKTAFLPGTILHESSFPHHQPKLITPLPSLLPLLFTALFPHLPFVFSSHIEASSLSLARWQSTGYFYISQRCKALKITDQGLISPALLTSLTTVQQLQGKSLQPLQPGQSYFLGFLLNYCSQTLWKHLLPPQVGLPYP